MATPHVIISGPIGAGKSTLTRVLADQLDWVPFLEQVDGPRGTPLIARMYEPGGFERWGFQVQTFFAALTIHQHYNIANLTSCGAAQDRSIYEHAAIFMNDLHAHGGLDQAEYELLMRIVTAAVEELPKPDLLVQLDATPAKLRSRILRRGRAHEITILKDHPGYLERLCAAYDTWLESFDMCPVLRLNADDVERMTEAQLANTVLNAAL